MAWNCSPSLPVQRPTFADRLGQYVSSCFPVASITVESSVYSIYEINSLYPKKTPVPLHHTGMVIFPAGLCSPQPSFHSCLFISSHFLGSFELTMASLLLDSIFLFTSTLPPSNFSPTCAFICKKIKNK